MQDFHFEMKTNKSSPKVMEACANGAPVKTATLVCRKAGGKTAVEFLKVVMTDVLVSSYQSGGQSAGSARWRRFGSSGVWSSRCRM